MSDPIEPAEADFGPGSPDPIDHLEVPPERGPQFAPPGGRASVLQPPARSPDGRRGKIALIAVLLLLLLLLGGIAVWRKANQPQAVAVPEFGAPPAVATVSSEPAPDVKDLLIRLDGLHEAMVSMRAETAQALRTQGEELGQLRVAVEGMGKAARPDDAKLLEAVQALGQRLQGLETSMQGLGQRLVAAATAPKPAAKPRAARPAAPRVESVNFWDSVPYATLSSGETLRAGEVHKGWMLVDVEDGRAILRGPDGRRVVQTVRGGH